LIPAHDDCRYYAHLDNQFGWPLYGDGAIHCTTTICPLRTGYSASSRREPNPVAALARKLLSPKPLTFGQNVHDMTGAIGAE
jgi:hypothetical protein